jgi:hypothetical protein
MQRLPPESVFTVSEMKAVFTIMFKLGEEIDIGRLCENPGSSTYKK